MTQKDSHVDSKRKSWKFLSK